MPDLADDVRLRVDGTHAAAEFLPEGVVVDLGRDVQPPAVDAQPDPVFSDAEQKFAHGRYMRVELWQGRQVPPAAIANRGEAVFVLQQPLFMRRRIRTPMFFSFQSFRVEEEPVLVGRAVAAFEHMMELPEAARGMVEHAVQNHADIILDGPSRAIP